MDFLCARFVGAWCSAEPERGLDIDALDELDAPCYSNMRRFIMCVVHDFLRDA